MPVTPTRFAYRWFLPVLLLAGTATQSLATLAQDIEAITGNRTKIVWAKAVGSTYESDATSSNYALMGFDTYEGFQRQIVPGPRGCANPWITPDGQSVIFSDISDTTVRIADWTGTNLRVLMRGFAQCVWRNPGDGTQWVYVNTVAGGDSIRRYQIDNLSRNDLVWNKTQVSIRFRVSADGSRAGGEFPWPAAGEATLPNGTLTNYGSGCNSSLAPDNSYRFFHLIGGHKDIHMYDLGPTNKRTISLAHAPGVDGGTVWIPKWSSDERFFTMSGPHGNPLVKHNIYLGQFNDTFTDVQRWLQVTNTPDSFDIYAYAWIGTAPRITFSPASVEFSLDQTGVGVRVDTVLVLNTGGTLPPLTAVSSAQWLHVARVGQVNQQAVVNTIDATGLNSGIYRATVSVSGVGVSAEAYSVSLRIDGAPRLAEVVCDPADVAIVKDDSVQFTARSFDQFAQPLASDVQWSVTGGGTISTAGFFKSNGDTGTYRVIAMSTMQPAITDTARLRVFEGIIILEPIGGETYWTGQTMHIRWNAHVPSMDGIAIYISPNGGLTWTLINATGAVSRNDSTWGDYPWAITDSIYDPERRKNVCVIGDTCLLWVCNYTPGAPGEVYLQQPFAIKNGSAVRNPVSLRNANVPRIVASRRSLVVDVPARWIGCTVLLLDHKGRRIARRVLSTSHGAVSLRRLAPGTYIVQFEMPTHSWFERVVVR